MSKVLVVEDDRAMAVALRDGLEYEGYDVTTAADGETGLRMARDLEPDLILLDIMLPKRSGLSVCRQIRSEGRKVPIIMLTARGQEMDKVTGLKVGADDYVTKPFGFLELAARVEAVLRRSQGEQHKTRYEFGDMVVDYEKLQVFKDNVAIALSMKEFELLSYFIDHRGQVVSRAELLQRVWQYRGVSNTRTVDMHVAKLRKKIEVNPSRPRYILTRHGVGYRFEG